MGEAALGLFSGDRAGMAGKLLLRGRGIHGGEDPHNLCSLSGGDVLGHVDDGVHGDFWIGLYQAGEKIRDGEKKIGRRVLTGVLKNCQTDTLTRAAVHTVFTVSWTFLCSNVPSS